MAEWIVLGAHGLWVMGINPIKAVGGVRKCIRPQLLLSSSIKPVPRPTLGFHTGYGWRLETDVS